MLWTNTVFLEQTRGLQVIASVPGVPNAVRSFGRTWRDCANRQVIFARVFHWRFDLLTGSLGRTRPSRQREMNVALNNIDC